MRGMDILNWNRTGIARRIGLGGLFALLLVATTATAAPVVSAGGTFVGGVPGRGVELALFSGGPVSDLQVAAPEAASFFATVDGEFLGYLVGAPDFVNAAFVAHFASEVPANTPLLVFTPSLPPIGDGPATLTVGESIGLDGDDRLTFAGVVSDSRCPVDVQCVWAGEAVLAFELVTADSTVARSVVFGAGGDASGVFGAYRVTVQALTPEPKSTVTIPPEGYAATIVVERQSAPPAGSGLEGVVTLGPLCPVQQLGVPCPDRVYSATLVLLDGNDAEVGRVTSGADGWYRLAVPAGAYTLVPQSPDGLPLPFAGPIDVTVLAGQYSVVDVSYDSGIR